MKVIPNITPDYILQNVDQEEVFSLYLDNQIIKPGAGIINTIRGESTPSVSCLLTGNNILYLKDFACSEFKGNCISWCVLYYKYQGIIITYRQACNKIIKDLNLDIRDFTYAPINHIQIDKSYSEIKPRIRLDEFNQPYFTKKDLQYWGNKYGITEEELARFKTYSLDSVYIKGKSSEYFVNNQDTLMFGYKYPIPGKWQIYQPEADKETKWRINHEYLDVVGLRGAPKMLVKSRKDRIILSKMNIETVRFASETYIPDSLIESIDFVLYDNDFDKAINQGQLSAGKICSKFDKKNLVLPTEYQAKDPSDLVEKIGLERTELIIRDLMLKA